MYRNKTAIILAGILFSFLSWNCTKIDTTSIGSGLIPAVDNVNTFDTLINVIANNFDSSSTDCAIIYPAEDHVLGYISNDPYFGTTKGSIFTELLPPTFPFNFPDGKTLDSVVLVLSYKRTYGDSTISQKVNVYPILGSFNPDSSSCTTTPYDASNLLGTKIYTPQNLPKDTVKVRGDTSVNELRIRLSTAFAQSLLSQDSAHAFKSDTDFVNFFRGFAIVPDVNFGGNALNYFNLSDSNTKLVVYMKYTAAHADTVINFRLTDLSHSSNNIVRNHAGSEITQHLSRPAAGDDVVYIQTLPGTYAEIKIPDLSSVSNRIIHKAELIMDQVYSPSPTDKYFYTPDYLYLEVRDTAGGFSYRPIPCDFNTLSGTPNLGTFGGFRTFVTDAFGNTIARYTFDLSRYVQKIVTVHRPSSTLRLKAPDLINIPLTYVDECNQAVSALTYPINTIVLGRVKLGGGNNVNYKMRLRIIYSKL